MTATKLKKIFINSQYRGMTVGGYRMQFVCRQGYREGHREGCISRVFFSRDGEATCEHGHSHRIEMI